MEKHNKILDAYDVGSFDELMKDKNIQKKFILIAKDCLQDLENSAVNTRIAEFCSTNELNNCDILPAEIVSDMHGAIGALEELIRVQTELFLKR